MVVISVLCPDWQNDQAIIGGITKVGKRHHCCQNSNYLHYSLVLDPAYHGRLPKTKERTIDMALNGSGIRDTARGLRISPTTVVSELKKRVGTQPCESTRARSVQPG